MSIEFSYNSVSSFCRTVSIESFQIGRFAASTSSLYVPLCPAHLPYAPFLSRPPPTLHIFFNACPPKLLLCYSHIFYVPPCSLLLSPFLPHPPHQLRSFLWRLDFVFLCSSSPHPSTLRPSLVTPTPHIVLLFSTPTFQNSFFPTPLFLTPLPRSFLAAPTSPTSSHPCPTHKIIMTTPHGKLLNKRSAVIKN